MVKKSEGDESVSAGDEKVERCIFSAAVNADGHAESLPLMVDRLLRGLQEAHNVITEALENLFDQEHYHWKIVKAMKATGTTMRVAGSGFGAAASISALNFAPVACSAGLGLGAAACSGIGTVFHLTAAVAGVHNEGNRHSKLRDFCCRSDVKKHHEAVENILKTIQSNVEQLRSRVELNNRSEAMLLSPANSEEVAEMDEQFPSQQNSVLEEPSMSKVDQQVIRLQTLLKELQKELSRFAEMDLELLESASSAMTEVAFHSVSMAMLFSLGTVSGASLAGMIAGTLMAAVSVADLVILIVGWHKVPWSIQALRKFREALGSLESAANAVQEFLHPMEHDEQTTVYVQQVSSAKTDCCSQQQEKEEFYDCLDEAGYQHCEISQKDSFETPSFCSFDESSRMLENNEVDERYCEASVKETNDESSLMLYERSQPSDVIGNILVLDSSSGFRNKEDGDDDEELHCSVTDATGPRRLNEVSQHSSEVLEDDSLYSFVASQMSDRGEAVLHPLSSLAEKDMLREDGDKPVMETILNEHVGKKQYYSIQEKVDSVERHNLNTLDPLSIAADGMTCAQDLEANTHAGLLLSWLSWLMKPPSSDPLTTSKGAQDVINECGTITWHEGKIFAVAAFQALANGFMSYWVEGWMKDQAKDFERSILDWSANFDTSLEDVTTPNDH